MIEFFKNLFSLGQDKNLVSLINDDAYLVDVRSPQEFADGNVKGSTNIPLDTVQSQLAKFQNKKHIIVFCRSGNRSGKAKSILEQNGFANVTNGGTWRNVKKATNE